MLELRKAMVKTRFFLFTIFIMVYLMILSNMGCRKTMRMNELVPYEMHGWRAQEKDDIYDRATLYQYMNGAAEIYLSYSFQQLLVRRFVKDQQPDIIVELFDMGSSEDAFGVFTHSRESEEMGIGQDSEYRGGLLCFWKGKFFVCVLTERQSPSTESAVLDLGRAISSAIEDTGSKPKLLDFLPAEGLLPRSVRYFHKHTSLNYHYFVADQNILHLDENSKALLARYQQAEGKSYLLLVQYQNIAQANAAFDSFVTAYIPEAKQTAMVQLEDGKWSAAKVVQQFVIAVFDAPSKAVAEMLLQTASNKMEVK